MNENTNNPLDYQGDILTVEGWEILKSALDFLPENDAAREAFMNTFAVQAARC